MKFYEIKRASGGFGEWDTGERVDYSESEFDDDRNLFEIYELGEDELPAGVEDIRGSIHNQTGRIFSLVKRSPYGEDEPDVVRYFGVEE